MSRSRAASWRTGFALRQASARSLILALSLTLVGLLGQPVGAETPTEVVDSTSDGVYVGRTRTTEFGQVDFSTTIAEAAKDGHSLLIIAPDESIPSTEAFALRVRQEADADITISFAEDGTIHASVSEELETRENQALTAARAAATPSEAAADYLDVLLTEPVREVPPMIRQIVSVVFYLLLALGVVVFIELAIRQMRRQRHKRRKQEARALAQSTGTAGGSERPEVDAGSR